MMDGGGPSGGISRGTADAVLAAIRKRQDEEAKLCRDAAAVWERFAAAHGLVSSSDDASGTRSVAGTVDGIALDISVVCDDDGWRHTLMTAEAKTAVDVLVAIYPSPKGIMGALKNALFGKEDVIVGDADFDRRFLIHSEPRSTAAEMLGASVRALIGGWCGNSMDAIQYDHGRIYFQSASVETTAAALTCMLSVGVALASWRPGPTSAYR